MRLSWAAFGGLLATACFADAGPSTGSEASSGCEAETCTEGGTSFGSTGDPGTATGATTTGESTSTTTGTPTTGAPTTGPDPMSTTGTSTTMGTLTSTDPTTTTGGVLAPYGPCTADADCNPGEYCLMHESQSVCVDLCMTVVDCPDPGEGEGEVDCVDGGCLLVCGDMEAVCPARMTCFQSSFCLWP